MIKYISMCTHSFPYWHFLLQQLLNPDQRLNSVNHLLHQFDFGEPDPLLIRNIPLAARACRGVFTIASSRLHSEPLGEVFQLVWS